VKDAQTPPKKKVSIETSPESENKKPSILKVEPIQSPTSEPEKNLGATSAMEKKGPEFQFQKTIDNPE